MNDKFPKTVYYICPKCKIWYTITRNARSHCDKCGSELIMKCPSCNNKIEVEIAEYCKYCGAKYLK